VCVTPGLPAPETTAPGPPAGLIGYIADHAAELSPVVLELHLEHAALDYAALDYATPEGAPAAARPTGLATPRCRSNRAASSTPAPAERVAG
jgi:hypothetical protein